MKGTIGTCLNCDDDFTRKQKRSRFCTTQCHHRYAGRQPERREQVREWRNANPEKRAAAKEAWKEADPEFYKASKWRSRSRGLGAEVAETFSKRDVHGRDGGVCGYCLKKVNAAESTANHVMPLKRGGSHTVNNCVTACLSCASKKRAMLPLNFMFRDYCGAKGTRSGV
jgi:5-methylcytosine-specific restriction endonuclease McrA